MRQNVSLFIAALAAVGLNAAVVAGEMATPKEAMALSIKAANAINEVGKDKAFVEFVKPDGNYLKKDLYVFCMTQDGVMNFHAKKPHLAGKNLTEFNKYGDFLFKNMIKLSKEQMAGWVDYKWPYPGSEEIREKTSFVITNNEGFFCGVGAYK